MNENETTGQATLSYEELRAMAVQPYERGAYSDSPLGEGIGLHVHGTQPGTDVHVYVAGYGKIAEVWPERTDVLAERDFLPPDGKDVMDRLPGLGD